MTIPARVSPSYIFIAVRTSQAHPSRNAQRHHRRLVVTALLSRALSTLRERRQWGRRQELSSLSIAGVCTRICHASGPLHDAPGPCHLFARRCGTGQMVSARSLSLGSWPASCPYSRVFCQETSPKLRHLFLSARAKFHLNLHSTGDIIILPGNPARNIRPLAGS